MDYPAIPHRSEDGAVILTFPDFPDVRAQGEYEADALTRGKDALVVALAACVKARRPVPPPSPDTGSLTVRVPALAAAKLLIYTAMRDAHIGRAELARRLRWHRPQVDRLLNVHHASRLDQLEAAVTVLGKRLTVDLVDDGESAVTADRVTPA